LIKRAHYLVGGITFTFSGACGGSNVRWNRLLAAMFFAIHPQSISGTALDNLSKRRADVAT
jgi:hypothetical protein